MNYNYHTHTFRCNHATGTEEEYIIRAIDNGIEYMGFSEHIPLVLDDGSQSLYRMPIEDTEVYFNTLYELRDKYKDQIEIKIGFEMEYYPQVFDEMLSFAKKSGAEYLILGQHFINPEYPSKRYVGWDSMTKEELKSYADNLIEGMKTKVFSYVAHPDVINFTGDKDLYRKELRRIIKASKELNIPLELNFLGMRKERYYPNMDFWELAGEENCPVTFGFDSHDAMSAYDEESLLKAEEIVKKYNLNYTGKPEIKEILL